MLDTAMRRLLGGRGPPIGLAIAWATLAGLVAGCGSLPADPFGWRTEASTETDPRGAAAETGDVTPLPKPTASPDSDAGVSAAIVARVQTRLAELGYAAGPIDGLYGRKTGTAIRRFQADTGLPRTGRISNRLLAALAALVEPSKAATDDAPITSGPPPAYRVGSQYVYADGDVRTVVAVSGRRVRWRTGAGLAYTTYHDFLLPPLEWRGPAAGGRSVADAQPEQLWPLTIGEVVAFTVVGVAQHGTRPDNRNATRETWRCRLEGSETVTVRAGTFDTRRITCDGGLTPDGGGIRRIWYYAPEVGHFIVHEETGEAPGRRRRVELLAVLPGNAGWPPVARAGLGWALQHALENGSAGEETVWRSSAVGPAVTIIPGPLAAVAPGEVCRSYVQVWSVGDDRRVYPGFACRIAAERWTIPTPAASIAIATNADD